MPAHAFSTTAVQSARYAAAARAPQRLEESEHAWLAPRRAGMMCSREMPGELLIGRPVPFHEQAAEAPACKLLKSESVRRIL